MNQKLSLDSNIFLCHVGEATPHHIWRSYNLLIVVDILLYSAAADFFYLKGKVDALLLRLNWLLHSNMFDMVCQKVCFDVSKKIEIR